MCEKRGEFSATGLPLYPVGLNQEQEVVGSAGWVAPSFSLKPHQTWCEEFLRQQFSSFLVLDQTDKGSFRKHIELIVCSAVSSPRKTHDRGEKKLTNNGNGVFFQGLRHRSKKVWGNWVSVDVRRRRRHVGGQILLRAHRRCKTFWTPNRKKGLRCKSIASLDFQGLWARKNAFWGVWEEVANSYHARSDKF